MKWNKTQHKTTDKQADNTQKKGSTYMIRTLGIFIIALSGSVYAQAMPLLFILMGGVMGIHPSAKASDMDTIIWILTSVAILVPLLLVYIAWNKYVWRRFVKQPEPLFNRKKHAA